MNFFSDEIRRSPFALYDRMRSEAPVLEDSQSGLWMLFDYESVKRTYTDHETFSSRHGPAEWLIFQDPPRHSKLRALISQAFTPRAVASLGPRIQAIARGLLDQKIEEPELDLAADFAVPLPMAVIAWMLGIPEADQSRLKRWNDVILNMSQTVAGKGGEASTAATEFTEITGEMRHYLRELMERRRVAPQDDLLTNLIKAEVQGERLSELEILGFFQLLLLAGSETTTNLVNNAILCLLEHPAELDQLRAEPGLIPSAIEEVLRFRSPLQWMFRLTRREAEFRGRIIPSGKIVLAMIGSANRDSRQFENPGRFDIRRDPNPHLAFGQGIHFCLGAALARLESRIALTMLLERFPSFELAIDGPWEPREGLHVHGPSRLPLKITHEPRPSKPAPGMEPGQT